MKKRDIDQPLKAAKHGLKTVKDIEVKYVVSPVTDNVHSGSTEITAWFNVDGREYKWKHRMPNSTFNDSKLFNAALQEWAAAEIEKAKATSVPQDQILEA
jgi:hypothetical protein